jgi:hypothetical protein
MREQCSCRPASPIHEPLYASYSLQKLLKTMKLPVRFFVLLFSVLIGLSSCHSVKDVTGRYRSKFAVNGFFSTTIILNTDSTFGYRMRGDMMFDTSNGTYQVEKKYVILKHERFRLDTAGMTEEQKHGVVISYALSTNLHLNDQGKYKIKGSKLFFCDSNGFMFKKAFGHSKRRKFLLFGSHWYKRRYYLKRVG